MILLHNHASGDPTPLRADIGITEVSRKAWGAADLLLCDRFVIAKTGHVSIREPGYP